MRIEEGKFYINGADQVIGPMYRDSTEDTFYAGDKRHGQPYYTVDGRLVGCASYSEDSLIAEWGADLRELNLRIGDRIRSNANSNTAVWTVSCISYGPDYRTIDVWGKKTGTELGRGSSLSNSANGFGWVVVSRSTAENPPEAPTAFVPDTDGPSELPPRIVGQLEMLKALTFMDAYGKLCVRENSFDISVLPEDTRATLMNILIQEEVQRRRDEAAKWEANIRSKLNLGAA